MNIKSVIYIFGTTSSLTSSYLWFSNKLLGRYLILFYLFLQPKHICSKISFPTLWIYLLYIIIWLLESLLINSKVCWPYKYFISQCTIHFQLTPWGQVNSNWGCVCGWFSATNSTRYYICFRIWYLFNFFGGIPEIFIH